MTNTENSIVLKAQELAYLLHNGKEYGRNSNMYEQIKALVEVLNPYTTLQGQDKDTLLAAAWLSKSNEPSKLGPEQQPLSISDISSIFGADVSKIVDELCTEEKKEKEAERAYKQGQLDQGVKQEDLKKEPKESVWLKKSIAALTLSHGAREILMAEKQSNFINDADTTRTKKGYAWHIEYYTTRMLMVEALKDTNPQLYKGLRDLAVSGIAAHIVDAYQKEGLTPEAICDKLVKNKSNILLSQEMSKIAGATSLLVNDAYQKAKKLINSNEMTQNLPIMPKPKDMPSYKRRVKIDLNKVSKQF